MKLNLFEWLTDRTTAYVERWHHRPMLFKESLADHHALTARMAYWLARLAGYSNEEAALTAVAALYHDEVETITGDIPASAKAILPGARATVRTWEAHAAGLLSGDAPAGLRGELLHLLHQTHLSDELRQIIRYADDLAALAFVNDQVEHGVKSTVILGIRASLLFNIAAHDWPWLVKLRKEYDLP